MIPAVENYNFEMFAVFSHQKLDRRSDDSSERQLSKRHAWNPNSAIQAKQLVLAGRTTKSIRRKTASLNLLLSELGTVK